MNIVSPIKSKAHIKNLKSILLAGEKGLRNNLLLTLGINSALRVSDLLKIKVGDVVGEDGKVKDYISLREKKTKKFKSFPINVSVKGSLLPYLKSYSYSREDYLFKSKKGLNKAITRQQAYVILKSAADGINLNQKIGTHSLRKTFSYHAYSSGIDISLLMDLLNHSSQKTTLSYIGITQEEKDNVVVNLNL